MSNPMKLGIYLIVGAIALVLLRGLFTSAINLLIPLAVIGGIGLILYSAINRKALGGGRRYLP
jgi:xanthine/uracil permease